jgi:hypothetical protein
MTKPVLFAMLITFLAMPAWAEHQEARSLAQLSKGESGQLLLVAKEDALQASPRLESIGLRGQYRDGRLFWVDRHQNGGTVVGMGFQRRF